MSMNHIDENGKLTVDEAVMILDSISGQDCESNHSWADSVLLMTIDPAVRAAYQRVRDRSNWWGCA